MSLVQIGAGFEPARSFEPWLAAPRPQFLQGGRVGSFLARHHDGPGAARLDSGSTAHRPNEFIDLPTGVKVTALAQMLQRPRGDKRGCACGQTLRNWVRCHLSGAKTRVALDPPRHREPAGKHVPTSRCRRAMAGSPIAFTNHTPRRLPVIQYVLPAPFPLSRLL